MTIDLNYFEQVFDETTLKRGLRLFETCEVELTERSGYQAFGFTVNGFAVFIRKKGNTIIENRCLCHKPKPCEHISAALFHFQQDILGLKTKKRGLKQSNKHISQFENYSKRIHNILESYLHKEKLSTVEIRNLGEALSGFISKNNQSKDEQFFKHLAFTISFAEILKLRFTGDESALISLFSKSKEQLASHCLQKLNARELAALEMAACLSIKNNAVLKSDAYALLVPLLLSKTKNRLVFNKLNLLMAKRKYKQTYSERLNRFGIVQQSVLIKLSGIPQPVDTRDVALPIETIIGYAEILFLENKTKKAFGWLERNYESVKKQRDFFIPFVEYVIEKAKRYRKPGIELTYLERNFLHGPLLSEQTVMRFLQIVPQKKQEAFIDQLIKKTRLTYGKNAFEKIHPLLKIQKKWQELFMELKAQKQKFLLVHDVCMQLLPDLPNNALDTYVNHFSQTVGGTVPLAYQQKLFDLVKNYLEALPTAAAKQLIEKLLFAVGKNLPIHGHIYSYARKANFVVA